MKKILLVTSSPRGEASHSTKLATELAHEFGGSVTLREVWRNPIPAIDPTFVHASYTPDEERTVEQRAALATSNELIKELKDADTIIIAAGMINFGLPATLKSWIDQIARKGETFNYGEAGPVGLLTGKKLILVLASGGVYTSGPMTTMNHLEPVLKSTLGFLGLTDVETIWIEGVAYGPEATEQALAAAKTHASEVLVGAR